MTAATGTGVQTIAVSGTGGTTIVATGKDARKTGVSATAKGGNGPRTAANGSGIMNAGRTGGGRSATTIAGIAATGGGGAAMTITGPIRAMAATTPTAIIATGAIMACAASAMATASIADMTGAITAAGTMAPRRSEEHTSELQSLMRISYAVFCLQKKTI